MKKIASVLFVLVLALSFLPARVSAQEFNVAVAPARQQINVKPGEHTRIAVAFVNRSLFSADGQVGTVDFIVKGNDNIPTFLDGTELNNRFSAASWITLPYDRATIPPTDKLIVYMDLDVPTDALPGGHYTAVYFEGSPFAGQAPIGRQGAALVAPRTAALIYFKVAGPVSIKSAVQQFFANKFWENGPITVSTQISNSGDIHITPQGKVTLTNMLGKIVDSSNLDSKNIFPGTLSKYENSLGKKWMLGRYSLNLTANDGVSTNPLNSSLYVWVLPWKLLSIIILSIVILLLLSKNIYKRLIGHERTMETEIQKEHQEIEKLKDELRRKEE